jgi:tetratricopeptide (TPR) repeat protein
MSRSEPFAATDTRRWLHSAAAIRIAGLVVSMAYSAIVVWAYVHQPQTIAEVRGNLTASVGAYEVDRAALEEALQFFRNDKFREARLAFERADPAHRDPATQFYVAYSYYREGWGRVYSDDALYRQGLEALARATAAAPDHRVAVADTTLGMHTSDELQAELERGLTREWSDLNPLRVLRDRK